MKKRLKIKTMNLNYKLQQILHLQTLKVLHKIIFL